MLPDHPETWSVLPLELYLIIKLEGHTMILYDEYIN